MKKRDFIPHEECSVMSGECFCQGRCLRGCRSPIPFPRASGSLNWKPTSENCLLPGYTVEQMIAYGDARVAAFKKEIGYE